MLSKRHLDDRVGKVRLAGLVLPEPDLMEALSADASAKMGMKLGSDLLVQAFFNPVLSEVVPQSSAVP